ncbi:MAG: NAD-dependent epimerase/dehydratase family protein [Saprospiraceae bacterium]|nr:NAD-dependent epimerase/dehydratase family protein [Saprospiraceae bacterium]
MLIPFRFFNATYFGNGQQWMSWIHIDDICRMFMAAIENEQLNGI